MKVMWCSKHKPLDSQLAELRRLFGGDVVVHRDADRFSDAQEILSRFHKSGATELVVVAPLSVLREICKLGTRPLWAEMQEVPVDSPLSELRTGKNGHGVVRAERAYKFVRFRRLVGVELQFEDFG
jgi:hypothetical protein